MPGLESCLALSALNAEDDPAEQSFVVHLDRLQLIVVAPTRELAVQVHGVAKKLSAGVGRGPLSLNFLSTLDS